MSAAPGTHHMPTTRPFYSHNTGAGGSSWLHGKDLLFASQRPFVTLALTTYFCAGHRRGHSASWFTYLTNDPLFRAVKADIPGICSSSVTVWFVFVPASSLPFGAGQIQ